MKNHSKSIEKSFYLISMVILVISVAFSSNLMGQKVTVFIDDFSNTDLSVGGIPTVPYMLSSTINPVDCQKSSGTLRISNGVATVNEQTIGGKTFLSAPLSGYNELFKSTLKDNSGEITWTFNFRTSKSTFNSFVIDRSNHGAAIVLASDKADLTDSQGKGYAVVFSEGNTKVKLVKFSNGFGSNTGITTLIGPSTESTNANYASYKVVYSPASDTWRLFYRIDGSSSPFKDPSVENETIGYFVEVGSSVIDNTYTSTEMTHFGFLHNHGAISNANNTRVIFDNYRVEIKQENVNIKKILPTDDTYVYGNGGNSPDVIRGLEDPYILKSYLHTASYVHEIYLKFDLAAISRNPEWIENVKLRMYGSDFYGSEHTLELFEKSGTVWDEDNLTYATVGTTGTSTKVASIKVNMAATQWYEWDITEFIKTCKTDNKSVICLMVCDSVRLKKGDTTSSVYATFDSKENPSGNAPHLQVFEKKFSELLLDEILVDNVLLNQFDSVRFEYTVLLPASATQIPVVTASPRFSGASVSYNHASSLTGDIVARTTYINVVHEDKSLQYSVTFEVAPLNNDAGVGGISVDDNKLEFFDKGKYDYTYYLPYTHPTSQIPAITYTASNPNQQIALLQAVNLTGNNTERTSIIRVKSGDLTEEKDYRITFEILPEMDLYFCIGQSNMAGRGYMNEALGDMNPINNTFLLTPALRWEVAMNPMNKYSSKRKELSMQRISPAYGFAINVKDKVSKPIGMVVNAKGASTITHWTKGNAEGLYEAALLRAKEAQKWGKFKAILWHQGEGDSGSGVTAYPGRVKAMVDNFRAELNEPDLYFVAGELAYWRGGGTGSTAFNEMIRTISTFLDNSDYISSEGSTPLINEADPHFDRESNILLGERYAEKVLEKIYGITSAVTQSKSNLNILTDKKKVTIRNSSSDTAVHIFDVTGRMIVSQKIDRDFEYIFQHTGIYIISVQSAGDSSGTYKLFIN